MVLPRPNSQLTALRNARNNRSKADQPQQNISDYLKRNNPLPSSVRRTTSPPPTREIPNNSNKILNGVVACLDVRTEDGDDVSQNFERALESMGAKTRRTFSDSITHLVFKNGSPATLKKAMTKQIHIVSLLWISSCKRLGKRVSETDFMIDKTQGLIVTTGKKRRKSMEPSKVRALVMNDLLQPSLSSSSEENSAQEDSNARRKTIATCSWEARDFHQSDKPNRKRPIRPILDEDPLNGVAAEIKLKEPRLSLPLSIERRNKLQPTSIIPIHAPSLEKKEQIKARFSIGKSEDVPKLSSSLSSPSPLKRRRRLTGNLTRFHSDSIPEEQTKYSIVLTSVPIVLRKQCEEAIKKLNNFELAREVTSSTTHVLVGSNRRTKSVTMGLLRGVWMLSPEWLVQCGQKNEILSETEYELSDWYPRTDYRKQHVLLPMNIHVISSNSGVELIQEMIQMAGGSVVSMEKANLIISDKPIDTNKPIVTDTWLFDSIEKWQNLSTDNYILA